MDPDRLLDRLYRAIGPLIFNRLTLYLTVAVFIGALFLLFNHIDKFQHRQPLLSWINMLYLTIALFLIKIPHEFGHGLVSKHYGSEVHEMGLMFLVFMPVMYCDASDVWMVGDKGKRMATTAAGIGVELTMAALATYVWAFTAGGTLINQFALNVMLVASVSTLLFNGNPLLRYDGYYFLMDLMEVPNLRQKGMSYLTYLIQRYVLGLDHAAMPLDVKGRQLGILGFALASTLYRWFIMFAIVVMVWKFLDPYGWGVVGGVLALGCVYSSFIAPLGRMCRFLHQNRHRIHLRLAATAVLVLTIGAAVYGFLLMPVEQRIDAQCVIRPTGAVPVYVSQAGFVAADPQCPVCS